MTRLVFAGIAALSVATGCRQAEAPPPAPASAPAVSTTSDDVQTRIGVMNFERGYPTEETTRKLFDEMDYQRAVQAYLWALSGRVVRVHPDRDQTRPRRRSQRHVHRRQVRRCAKRLADGKRHHDLRLHERRSRQVGPVVVDVPPGRIVGLIDDFWQRVDRRRRAARSRWRQGRQVPAAAARLQGRRAEGRIPRPARHDEQLQRHGARHRHEHGRRARRRADRQEAAGLSVERTQQSRSRTRSSPCSGKTIDTLPPAGLEYWARLSAVINNNPVQERDRFFMAMLKPLGIEKGKPFKPDARQRAILEDAARIGDAMGRDDAVRRRSAHQPAPPPFGGTHWNWVRAEPSRPGDRTLQPARRAAALHLRRHLHVAGHRRRRSRPWSEYVQTFKDKDGNHLDGGQVVPAARARRTCRPRPSGR